MLTTNKLPVITVAKGLRQVDIAISNFGKSSWATGLQPLFNRSDRAIRTSWLHVRKIPAQHRVTINRPRKTVAHFLEIRQERLDNDADFDRTMLKHHVSKGKVTALARIELTAVNFAQVLISGNASLGHLAAPHLACNHSDI